MAYGGPSRQKDNFNRFQKQATINFTKQMQKLAETTRINVRQEVADELLKKYKDNVLASYSPRSTGTYEHAKSTFIDSIDVEIEEDKGVGRDRVKIVLDENKKYPSTLTGDKEHSKTHSVTVKEVYEFLTEGTKGGGYYRYFDKSKGKWIRAHNYPTPAHLFEQHTQLQMKGYLESLESDIQDGKYSQ